MFRANVSLKWTNNQDFTYDTGHNAMVYCYSSMKIERIWYFLSPFLPLYLFITSIWRFLEFTLFLHFPLLINRITQYEVSVHSIFSNLTIESMLPWWTIEFNHWQQNGHDLQYYPLSELCLFNGAVKPVFEQQNWISLLWTFTLWKLKAIDLIPIYWMATLYDVCSTRASIFVLNTLLKFASLKWDWSKCAVGYCLSFF